MQVFELRNLTSYMAISYAIAKKPVTRKHDKYPYIHVRFKIYKIICSGLGVLLNWEAEEVS